MRWLENPRPALKKRVPQIAVRLGVLALLAAPPAAAQTVIESFRAEIAVLPDGTVDVTETIRPHFTAARRGIYRTIPVEYRSPQGFNYSLLFDNITVKDQNERPLKYESSRTGHYRKFKVYVPGAE